jgi:hypothetical protein
MAYPVLAKADTASQANDLTRTMRDARRAWKGPTAGCALLLAVYLPSGTAQVMAAVSFGQTFAILTGAAIFRPALSRAGQRVAA